MDQLRKERIAKNEASARDLNDRFGLGFFTCECGDSDCHQIIHVPLEIYRSIRMDDRRFIICPGHEVPAMEDVVLARDGWAVVRKHDAVAHVVER
ncbi:MAG: hypothetical protein QOG63_3077 [Thermoleophilaceae bacterium]|nr:hypothetical protein [Thermoleophilaceae bacterium]